MQKNVSEKVKAHVLLPWLMWGAVVLFYFYQFFIRVYPSVIFQNLIHFFHIDAETLGFVVGVYYISYTVMQIPIGILLDKFGTKKVVTVSILLCSLGSYLFIASENLWLAYLGRFLTGIGSSGGFCSCLKIANNWLNQKQLNIASTATVSIGVMGAVFGVPLFTALLTKFDWRSVLILISVLGILLSILIYKKVKDTPEEFFENKESRPMSIKKDFQTVISNKKIWIFFIYGFLMYAPLSAFADMWGVPLIKSMYNFSDTTTAWVVMSFYLGMIFGPCLSYVSDLLNARKSIMLICSISSTILFYLIVFIKMEYAALLTCVIMSGFLTSCQVLMYPMAFKVLPRSVSGLASGFLNMSGMLAGAILQPLIGKILVYFWNGETVSGMPSYSTYAYQMGMSTVPIFLLLSIPVILMFSEKK